MTKHLRINTIEVVELHAVKAQRPITLIDVRTPEEFRQYRAVDAVNMPLDSFDPLAVVNQRTGSADEPIYFICEVGVRSAHACGLMISSGTPNVVNVEGGTQAWAAAGFPIEGRLRLSEDNDPPHAKL